MSHDRQPLPEHAALVPLRPLRTLRFILAVMATAAAIVLIYRMHAPGGVWLGDFNWVLIPLAMGLAMAALVVWSARLGGWVLGNAPLQFVGRISYSVYLYHLPLLLLWNKYAPAGWGWVSLPGYLAIVGAVAYASWRWVEVPYLSARPAARAKAHREGRDDGEALEQRHAP